QLMRGAGVRGLAGMPLVRGEERLTGTRAGRHTALLRPLLRVPRAEIERYATDRGLEWIEDESNDDVRYMRNWLRHEGVPRLASRTAGGCANRARAREQHASGA